MTARDIPLLLEQEKWLDRLCTEFDSSFRAGKRPQIEAYLSGHSGPERGALLFELLRIEFEYLQNWRRLPAPEHYWNRFANDRGIVDAAYQDVATRSDTDHRAGTNSLALSTMSAGSFGASGTEDRTPWTTDESSATATTPLPTIGTFQLIQLIGSGAFGQVYKAWDKRLHRMVAIKTPFKKLVNTDGLRQHYLAEARAAASLKHPNICTIHDVKVSSEFPFPGCPFIVMSYIEGHTLSQRISQKDPLPTDQIIAILSSVAEALSVAHQKGVIHRDLKPANIIISDDENKPYVVDFGLAFDILAREREPSDAGQIAGTPAYMSPEQARGELTQLGPASDIFSLGVILYELLAGRRPFDGSLTDTLNAVQHKEPVPPSKLKPSVDPRLESICLKAISKRIEDRYSSMAEFAAELRELNIKRPTNLFWVTIALIITTVAGVILSLSLKTKDGTEVQVEITSADKNTVKNDRSASDPGSLPAANTVVWRPLFDQSLRVIHDPGWKMEGDVLIGDAGGQRVNNIVKTFDDVIAKNMIVRGEIKIGTLYHNGAFQLRRMPGGSKPQYISAYYNGENHFGAFWSDGEQLIDSGQNGRSTKSFSDFCRFAVVIIDSDLEAFADRERVLKCIVPYDNSGSLALVAKHYAEMRNVEYTTLDGIPEMSLQKAVDLLFDRLDEVSPLSSESVSSQTIPPDIDLLANVDLEKQGINGSWRRDDAAIVSPIGRYSGLALNVEPAPEYELEFDLARRSGDQNMAIGLSLGSSRTMVMLDHDGSKLSGIDTLWGNRFNQQCLATWHGDALIGTQQHTIRVVVHTGRIEVFRDKTKLIDWQGDPANLGIAKDWEPVARAAPLTIGTYESEIAISRIHYWASPRTLESSEAPPAIAIGPFDEATAKQRQRVWAEYLGIPPTFRNSLGMEFSLIPPCECELGGGRADEPKVYRNDRHRVRFTRPLYVGVTEVTQDQYTRVRQSNPSLMQPDRGGAPDSPVEAMGYFGAIDFARALSQLESESVKRRYYRLPTEQEWENAARASIIAAYPWGETVSLEQANLQFGTARGRTVPVKSYPPNAWGLYDVIGNVQEFTWDARRSPKLGSFTIDPVGPSADRYHPVRGGGFGTRFDGHPLSTNVGWTHGMEPDIGFRVVLEIPVDTEERNFSLGTSDIASENTLPPVATTESVQQTRFRTTIPHPLFAAETQAAELWKCPPGTCWTSPVDVPEAIPGDWPTFDFTADGTRLVSGNAVGDLWAWRLADCTRVGQFPALEEPVGQLICSPVEPAIAYALGGQSGVIHCLNADDFSSSLVTLNGLNEVDQFIPQSIALSLDGKLIAVAGSEKIFLVELESGNVVTRMNGTFPMAFSRDGSFFGRSSQLPHQLLQWNGTTGQIMRSYNGKAGETIFSVALSPDGNSIAAGLQAGIPKKSPGNTLRIWDVRDTSVQQTLSFQENSPGTWVTFSPDGQTIWASGHGSPEHQTQRRIVQWHLASESKLVDLPEYAQAACHPRDPSVWAWRRWNSQTIAIDNLRLTKLRITHDQTSPEPGTWTRLIVDQKSLAIPDLWRSEGSTYHVGGISSGKFTQRFDAHAKNVILRSRLTKNIPQLPVSTPNVALAARCNQQWSVTAWFNGGDWFGGYRADTGTGRNLGEARSKKPMTKLFDMSVILVDDTMRLYAGTERVREFTNLDLNEPGYVELSFANLSERYIIEDYEMYVLDSLPNVSLAGAEKILFERLRKIR